jgi:hypothetical protein
MPHGIGGRHGMHGWLAEMSGRRASCQYRRNFHSCLELTSSPQPLAISEELQRRLSLAFDRRVRDRAQVWAHSFERAYLVH